MSQLPTGGERLPHDVVPDLTRTSDVPASDPMHEPPSPTLDFQTDNGGLTPPAADPSPAPPAVPAGWYPDPENTSGYRYGGLPSMRYFDGTQWTEHRAPIQRTQQQQRFPQQPIFVQQNMVAPPVVVRSGSSSMAGLHLVLTILTCGLWLPVWILIEIIQAASNR